MADGYARASGQVGVCLVTSGPGATNTVTGIASAYMDSIPIVVFTGQVPTELIGNDAFQEVDIVGITRPCTKHNYLVKRVEDLARVIKEPLPGPLRTAGSDPGGPAQGCAQGRHRVQIPEKSRTEKLSQQLDILTEYSIAAIAPHFHLFRVFEFDLLLKYILGQID